MPKKIANKKKSTVASRAVSAFKRAKKADPKSVMRESEFMKKPKKKPVTRKKASRKA